MKDEALVANVSVIPKLLTNSIAFENNSISVYLRSNIDNICSYVKMTVKNSSLGCIEAAVAGRMEFSQLRSVRFTGGEI